MHAEAGRAAAEAEFEADLERLKGLLRIPSISALPEYSGQTAQAAQYLAQELRRIGMTESTVIATNGHPVVRAERQDLPGGPWVTFYGHYDVQPPDPLNLWISAPFDPVVRNGSVYARGASDDKGQLWAVICGVAAVIRAQGRLPVNVRFLVEGEEESAGKSLAVYLSDHRHELHSDVVFIADGEFVAVGMPALHTGLRGMLYLEITVFGADRDLHSGIYGGIAPNPLNSLAWILSGLKDENGHVRVDGFYEQVRQPADEELRRWAELPLEPSLEADIGVVSLEGELGYSTLERRWSRPTMDVHGIWGGFSGHGSKTVIPSQASAKFSFRLVPDQDPHVILESLRRRITELLSPGVRFELEVIDAVPPASFAIDTLAARAAEVALERGFGDRPGIVRTGGSIPVAPLLQQFTGGQMVVTGFGLPDDNLHSPNEKLGLDQFRGGVASTIEFLFAIAAGGVKAD